MEELYHKHEKILRLEIEQKKKEALDAAGGDRRKMNFDIMRDVYKKEVQKKAIFNLNVDFGDQAELSQEVTPEMTQEIEFKNQVYERAFQELEAFVP